MTHPPNTGAVSFDGPSHSSPKKNLAKSGLRCALASLGNVTLETKNLSKDWRWPDFSLVEMGCRHCGQTYHWPEFMDALQMARDQIGRPLHILSAHRCSLHNARVGGAPKSQHLQLAVDIALHGHDPGALHAALANAGFMGFGFYTTFIHADMGPTRQWFGTRKARTQWQLD